MLYCKKLWGTGNVVIPVETVETEKNYSLQCRGLPQHFYLHKGSANTFFVAKTSTREKLSNTALLLFLGGYF
jgi:hypothetical protein